MSKRILVVEDQPDNRLIIRDMLDSVITGDRVNHYGFIAGQLARRVQASKAPSSAEEYALAARMILAKYIIEAAQTGERDPLWLADSALLHLSRQKLSRTPPKNSP